jgi:hypothetical protein
VDVKSTREGDEEECGEEEEAEEVEGPEEDREGVSSASKYPSGASNAMVL